MTLSWNNFNDNIFRRVVNDLVMPCGMAVVKRSNDPNYGIKESYVDPVNMFIHSYTEDPFDGGPGHMRVTLKSYH